jgi:hypothetical protein
MVMDFCLFCFTLSKVGQSSSLFCWVRGSRAGPGSAGNKAEILLDPGFTYPSPGSLKVEFIFRAKCYIKKKVDLQSCSQDGICSPYPW